MLLAIKMFSNDSYSISLVRSEIFKIVAQLSLQGDTAPLFWGEPWLSEHILFISSAIFAVFPRINMN